MVRLRAAITHAAHVYRGSACGGGARSVDDDGVVRDAAAREPAESFECLHFWPRRVERPSPPWECVRGDVFTAVVLDLFRNVLRR